MITRVTLKRVNQTTPIIVSGFGGKLQRFVFRFRWILAGKVGGLLFSGRMPRSSHQKLHRSHKRSGRDGTERSDSEDDGSSRNRTLRLVEAGAGSGTRVSRDGDTEKWKGSSSRQVSLEKDRGGSKNGDLSSGRKRKEREDSATSDRWNGSGKDNGLPETSSKEEDCDRLYAQKVDKSRFLTVESKSKSSMRRELSTDRYVESSNKTEPVKRRSEKEHTRREYRDDKERDMDHHSEREKDRECASERGKNGQDSRYGRSDETESKSHRSRRTVIEVELKDKKDSTENQAQDDLKNAVSEKDSEKFMTKRRKGLHDRRLSSSDYHIKNGSHKIEGHKDERYKDEKYHDKYFKELDRDQGDRRHRDIRRREEPSSRDYISDRLESKSVRDRGKHVESNNKSRLHESDRELSPHADDHGIKMRDNNRLRKRSSNEIDDHYGLGKISTKKSRPNIDKDASNSSKFDHGHRGKVETFLGHSLSRSSLSPKAHSSKEQIRRGLKQAKSTHGEPARDGRVDDRDRISVVHERVSDSLSLEKPQHRDRVNSVERERQLVSNNLSMENNSLPELQTSEHASGSPPLFKRPRYLSSSSPGHHLPQPPMRHGTNSSSPYEDETRVTSGNHRSNSRYRSSDPNMERGPGGAWKNGPHWPAPFQNSFFPFQHGPPASAFTIPPFPPAFYGARPYMEMNHARFPYQMHEMAGRFPGHSPPFGWHHPVGDSWLPQMNGWDGGSSLYRGPDWSWNSYPIHGQSSELNIEMSKGPSSSMSEFSSHLEQTDAAADSRLPSDAAAPSRLPSDAAAHPKKLNDTSNKRSMKAYLESNLSRGFSIPTKSYDGHRRNLGSYLSKIDISEDLTHPELYKEVTDLLASGNLAGSNNVSKVEDAENNRILISKKLSIPQSTLLPGAAEASFKRAMSVYEKQKCRRHLKPPPPPAAVCPKEADVSLEAPVEEPSTVNDNSASTLAGEEGKKSINGDAGGSPALMEVENIESPDVDVLESSRTCEAMMPVCKGMK
ncbi:zinc finger CCCH domain-containing protein 13 isoform X2 [Phalaenopsis equestris]|uniref:zinc finger CCCH domain-containing protein 13 isoform X2 n=1 Tax=Phalaenopsis equestris TaxID=78828 RepID=UPI0009E1BE78|nr:zinc finger CCCH domain-containing protein 13 isoform X2 [Phalaenopsis equestris]